MDKLFIHPRSSALLDAYINIPTQGLLLSGPAGVGAATIAQSLAKRLRARSDDIHLVRPDEKGTISIETIRPLYKLTRAIYESPRVIIIDDADAMSPAAQNALLKLLEEPTSQTFFILTTHQQQVLLATITSRVQHIALQPIDTDQSRELITHEKVPAAEMPKFLFMAAGLPAELIRMARDDGYYQKQSEMVTRARALLQMTPYERLASIKDIKTRDQAMELTSVVGRLLEFTVLRNKRGDLAHTLNVIEEVMSRLDTNGNVKIQLMYLATKLP